MGNAVLIVNRKRFSPVTLSAECRITKAILYFPFADSFLFDLFNGPANGLVHGQSVQEARIDHDGILPCVSFFGYIHILCDGGHRQLKVPGEPEITFVSCWKRPTLHGPVPGRIGSASCRDSVCPYVYMTVVAVTLKKKTGTQI